MSKPNKVHLNSKSKKRALCGCDAGGSFGNQVPKSTELRDVTCQHCLRMAQKKR